MRKRGASRAQRGDESVAFIDLAGSSNGRTGPFGGSNKRSIRFPAALGQRFGEVKKSPIRRFFACPELVEGVELKYGKKFCSWS